MRQQAVRGHTVHRLTTLSTAKIVWSDCCGNCIFSSSSTVVFVSIIHPFNSCRAPAHFSSYILYIVCAHSFAIHRTLTVKHGELLHKKNDSKKDWCDISRAAKGGSPESGL